MTVLEQLLRQERFEFPSAQQLAWILFNSSFGFRPHESCPAGEIRRSREATAIVVVNRVRQLVAPPPGWERDAPSREHGPAVGTEPAVQLDRPGYGLEVPGNREAYNDCLAAAQLALHRRALPLDSPQLLGGPQAYGHVWVCCWRPTVADSVNRCRVILRYGPLWSPNSPNEVPGRYVDTSHGQRRCNRCHRDLTHFRRYLLVGKDEGQLQRARNWESRHAEAWLR